MKRFWVAVAVLAVGLVGFASSAYAGVNDFRFTSFEADYYLDKDSEGRSTLKTVERLTAEFPQINQNHGIERAIPGSYDGHKTSLKVESVTDGTGASLPYSIYESNGNKVVRIGDKYDYVHGTVTYVLTYTQRDVTKSFDDRDEFYWDTNGTEWRQPFDSVAARVHVSDRLKGALNGDVACYSGTFGSNDHCNVASDNGVMSVRVDQLPAGGNVTVAVGFKSDTFESYQPTLAERLLKAWLIYLAVSSILGVVLIVWLSIRYYSRSNRKSEMGTIVPEYLPPKGVSVLIAEKVGQGTKAGMTAQIMDLAVRHYLKVYETREKSLFKSAEYELEIIKPIDDLTQEEQLFLRTLFGKKNTRVGSKFPMKNLKNNYKIAAKFQKNAKQLETLIKGEYALRHKVDAESKWFKRVGIITLVVAALSLSPVLVIASIVAFSCMYYLHPVTDKGLELRRYLEGLKLYISVAEEERLRMLQSPEGAEKTGVKTADSPKYLIKLYERVLPYAVLFGQEKEWNKHLGKYYEQNGTQPDWYSGQSTFNAVAFTSAMNSFSSTTSSYSASTSSSSSGSSGGGSSGGGGGGGGGGGW